MIDIVAEAIKRCPALKDPPHCEHITCEECRKLRELKERMENYWCCLNSYGEQE